MRSAKTIGGFGLAIIISLFFIELFARYAYIENRSLNDYYEDIGRGRRRNFNYVHFNEGFGIGRFNEQRFIGGDLVDNSPSGSIRIALLGDSYVESFQVFERDYFGSKTSSILNFNYPEERIDVMNFGRSGFGLKNVYAYHKSFVEGFDPDYVLYFISGDDIRSSSNDPLLPRVYSVDNELRIDHHIDPLKIEDYEKTKWLIQNIVLVNMINNCFKKAREVPLGSILLDKFYTSWSSPVESKPETEKDILNGYPLLNQPERALIGGMDTEWGPDGFGYEARDQYSGGAPYQWYNNTVTGTEFWAGQYRDDDWYEWVSLPFDFPYYDSTFNQISISADMIIRFTSGTVPNFVPVPNSAYAYRIDPFCFNMLH